MINKKQTNRYTFCLKNSFYKMLKHIIKVSINYDFKKTEYSLIITFNISIY